MDQLKSLKNLMLTSLILISGKWCGASKRKLKPEKSDVSLEILSCFNAKITLELQNMHLSQSMKSNLFC